MTENRPNNTFNQRVPEGLTGVKHLIAIGSGKGGVGKSTVAVNLAMALLKKGLAVGLMDADIYGPSQPKMLGSKSEQPQVADNLLIPITRYGLPFMSVGLLIEADRPVIWRAPIATKMIQEFIGSVRWGKLDYLLIDLPPGTGDVQITLAQQAQLTGAVIVTTPQQVALGVARKGLQMFESVRVPVIGIIENMSGFVCPQCGHETAIFKEGGGETMASDLGINFLGRIPIDPELMASGDDGIPLLEKKSTSPAAKAFSELADRLAAVVAQMPGSGSHEPQSISLSAEGDLLVSWPDGHVSTFTPYDLRINCPCASCVDENTGQRTLDPKQIPLSIKIENFGRVGRYAVGVSFSDGHNTGFFTFELLERLDRQRNDSSRESFNV